LNTPPTVHEGSLRQEAPQHEHALPPGVEGPEVPPVEVESKLHMALGYQPEPRMYPFGCLVWYLGKIKDPVAPKILSPNGKPAVNLSPEVGPGLRSKDIHLLLGLRLFTSTGQLKEISTRDFIEPAGGGWIFSLTRVRMLKQLADPTILDQPPAPRVHEDEGGDDTIGDIPAAVEKLSLHLFACCSAG